MRRTLKPISARCQSFSAALAGKTGALKQSRLSAFGRLEPELLVAEFGGDAALRGALQVTLHDQVRLVDFFQSVRLFADGDREGVDADGTAAEFDDHGFEDSLVHFFEAV